MPDLIKALAARRREVKKYRTAELLNPGLDRQPQFRAWDDRAAVEEGLKASPYVFACVRRRALAQGSVPWSAYRLVGDRWEVAPDSPLTTLMENPNPKMSRKDLIVRSAMTADLGGNFVWTKILVNGLLVEVWPLPLHPIIPVPSKQEFISHYEYSDGGGAITLPAETVVHHQNPDPGNPYWGIGRLQAVARTVDTEVDARRWNKVALQNRAVADGVFSFREPVSPEEWEIARDQVREQHQGSSHAREPWVLGHGATWQQMGLSPVDMDFINGIKLGAVEICAVFDVPPPMIGIFEDATLANLDTSRTIFWEDGVIPDLDSIELTLNRDITPHFGRLPGVANLKSLKDMRNTKRGVAAVRLDELLSQFREFQEWVKSGERDRMLKARSTQETGRRTGETLWLGFDLSGVEALAKKLKERIEAVEKLVFLGIPLNQALQVVELEIGPIPGGDIPRVDRRLIEVMLEGEEQDAALVRP